ncbi:hypothetical protein RCL1_003648 [Eukaryota sp. TZLM3-RCL]
MEEPVQSVVDVMQKIFSNELLAPDLLPFEADIVEDLRSMIDEQESYLYLDDNQILADDQKMVIQIYRLELDRLNYLLASYLRCRITKIEQFWPFLSIYVNQNPDTNLLSRAERFFLRDYVNAILTHFNSSFLNHIQLEDLQTFFDIENQQTHDAFVTPVVSPPDINQFVFARPTEDIGDWLISDVGSTEKLEKGELYFLNYSFIRSLVLEKKMDLL